MAGVQRAYLQMLETTDAHHKGYDDYQSPEWPVSVSNRCLRSLIH